MSLRKTKSCTKRAPFPQRRRRWQIIVFKSGAAPQMSLFSSAGSELHLPFNLSLGVSQTAALSDSPLFLSLFPCFSGLRFHPLLGSLLTLSFSSSILFPPYSLRAPHSLMWLCRVRGDVSACALLLYLDSSSLLRW